MTDLPTLPLAGLLGIEIVEAGPDKVVALVTRTQLVI